MFSDGWCTRIVRHGFAMVLIGSIVLAAGAARAAQLTLNWVDNAAGTANFAIERRTETDAYTQLATTGPGVTTYIDSTVREGTTYCFRVKASNPFGDSSYSNEACVTVSGSGNGPGPGPVISMDATTAVAGGAVTATWSGIPSPSPTDWIGLFVPGDPDTAFIDWVYVNCSKTAGAAQAAGACALAVPSTLPAGAYELRLEANNGYSPLATSALVTVGSSPVINVDASTVTAGDTVAATWSGIPSPSPTDWIGLFVPGDPDTAFIDWVYVSCSKTPDTAQSAGSCSFVIPPTLPEGTYELRLEANNSFSQLAASAPTVVTP